MGCSFHDAISTTANNIGYEYESDITMPRHLSMHRLLLPLLFVAVLGTMAIAQDYKGHKYQGTIDSISNSKIVIREPDAKTIAFLIAPQAKIMRDNRPAPLEALQRDDVAIITAERDGNLLVALTIFVVEPE